MVSINVLPSSMIRISLDTFICLPKYYHLCIYLTTSEIKDTSINRTLSSVYIPKCPLAYLTTSELRASHSLISVCVCVMYSAQLDQEMLRDESIIDKNESSQHQFQTLLNQKVCTCVCVCVCVCVYMQCVPYFTHPVYTSC